MSVAVVERWAQPGRGLGSAVGQIRLRTARTPEGIPTPTRGAVAMPTLQATLAATGLQLRRSPAVKPRSAADECLFQQLQQLLPRVGRGTSRDFDWEQQDTGEYWLRINHARVHVQLADLRQRQATEFGNINIPDLLQSNIYGDGLLLHKTGRPVRLDDFLHVAAHGDRFQDVLEIDWHSTGDLLFRPVRLQFPLPPPAAESFRWLCDAIVSHYPGLLRCPGQPEDLVLRPPSLDVWRLRRAAHAYQLECCPAGDVAVLLGSVTTTDAATAVARHAMADTTVRVGQHDWLDQPYALWKGGTAPTTETAKKLLRGPSRARATREYAARMRRWINSEHERLTAPTTDNVLATHAALQTAWRRHVLASSSRRCTNCGDGERQPTLTNQYGRTRTLSRTMTPPSWRSWKCSRGHEAQGRRQLHIPLQPTQCYELASLTKFPDCHRVQRQAERPTSSSSTAVREATRGPVAPAQSSSSLTRQRPPPRSYGSRRCPRASRVHRARHYAQPPVGVERLLKLSATVR